MLLESKSFHISERTQSTDTYKKIWSVVIKAKSLLIRLHPRTFRELLFLNFCLVSIRTDQMPIELVCVKNYLCEFHLIDKIVYWKDHSVDGGFLPVHCSQ